MGTPGALIPFRSLGPRRNLRYLQRAEAFGVSRNLGLPLDFVLAVHIAQATARGSMSEEREEDARGVFFVFRLRVATLPLAGAIVACSNERSRG